MENVFRKLDWQSNGINIDGEHPSQLIPELEQDGSFTKASSATLFHAKICLREKPRRKEMDVLLQTHGAKRIFPVPDGLRELTSDIVREVLRHQPDCIHSFIADYLETMLVVREKARDSVVVVSDIFRQGYFFDDLYRTKKITREAAEAHASIIQAGWRGYVIRKKFRMYLQKRRKIKEEKELKKSIKIEEFLESIGITYEEATRAACIIQAAYRQARRGTWIVNESGEEVWMEGEVPIGQRIREGDKSQGRYDRWEKKDWGDFFEMDEQGEIIYDWPHVGQLRKIPRKLVTPDMEILEFYAMRDLQGKEQYSYLKGPQKGRDPRGFPIGFLIPLPRDNIDKNSSEVAFVNPLNNMRMGVYGYVFEKVIEKEDLNQFAEVLRERNNVKEKMGMFLTEIQGEFDYDPDWVVPKILIQIRKDCLTGTDDEVVFVNEEMAPENSGMYTFRAENTDISLKVMEYVLRSTCGTVEEAVADAANITQYKDRLTGRLLAVEDFKTPKYIQKVVIQPETKAGKYENKDMDTFEYVFLPKTYRLPKRWRKPENPITIPMTRFQGHRSNYLGSMALDDQVFIMGPMLHSPDGKPMNYESIFWDEFGPECWYQLLCNITNQKIARLGEITEGEDEVGEAEGEMEEEEEEEVVEEEEAEEEYQEETKDEQEETAKEAEPEETAQPQETDLSKTEETEKTELQDSVEQKAEQNPLDVEDEVTSQQSAEETEPHADEEEADKE